MDNLFAMLAIVTVTVSVFAGFQPRAPLAQRRPKQRAVLMWSTAMLLFFFSLPSANAAVLSSEIPHFQFELQAQQHCPADAIVWVVPTRGLYNSSSERWYGRTSNGTYACLGDAEKAGYHATSATTAAQ